MKTLAITCIILFIFITYRLFNNVLYIYAYILNDLIQISTKNCVHFNKIIKSIIWNYLECYYDYLKAKSYWHTLTSTNWNILKTIVYNFTPCYIHFVYFFFTFSCLYDGSCPIYVICICFRILVFNTYWFVFLFCCLCLVYLMLPVSLDCTFVIASSLFSNLYLSLNLFSVRKVWRYQRGNQKP
jgi:hypothetical protein